MRTITPIAIVAVLGLAIANSCFFIVNQSQKSIMQRLGKFITVSGVDTARVYEPGLHFKMPIIDTVHYLDERIHTFIVQKSRIVTSEKKDVLVDLFVQWEILDFDLFFRANSRGQISRAERLLKQKTIDGLSAEFGRRTIKEVVSGERGEIMQRLKTETNRSAKSQGIEVIDVRIKRIDLPDEVSSAVYARMRTERNSVASRFRADGHAQAEVIRADADRKVRVTMASAKRDAEKTRGQGDSLAVRIYADSYNQDPELFEFVRSLQAYKKSFNNKQDVLVMRPEGKFFQYFRGDRGK